MTKRFMSKLAVLSGLAVFCFGCLPQPPTFDPEPGSYSSGQTITINNSTDGINVCYSLDGSDPTQEDTCFTGISDEVEIGTSTLIKAKAIDGENESVVVAGYFSIEALVAKTGQTISMATGDDGHLEMGVEWPSPRFIDNLDGTVTDRLTGLIWLKNANCFGTRSWAHALSDSNTLASDSCGLADGSLAGDWRLPNVFELESILDMGRFIPALPLGHPFSGIEDGYHWSWSSTTHALNPSSLAWSVDMAFGSVDSSDKDSSTFYVWPVRGPE